jgi:DmsE family decaheme c-type cytochrome
MEANLAGGPHTVLLPEVEDGTTMVSCTSCHAGSSDHWEDDPESYPMFMPSSDTYDMTGRVCGSCHLTVHQENQMTLSPHANARVGCVECHRVHGAQETGLLQAEQPGLCYGCHGDVQGQFAKPTHHPVAEGFMDCTDCHLMRDDEMAQLERHGKNAPCMDCHNEFQGPFPYDHQAAVDYSTEEGGCINCHDPHGSYLPRMFTQPYEGPHFQLCSQCHVVPRHNFNPQHGTTFAGVDCAECHADIHGSYTSRKFFPPTLAAQGCFAAGCHQP